MTQWWETPTPDQPGVTAKLRAVAYYRHSAQDRQENSIPIQRNQVREWADKNGVEIIQEFADAGKSGLNAEDRPAFNDLMDNWVSQRDDFHYLLCLDVSRWDGSRTSTCRSNTARSARNTASWGSTARSASPVKTIHKQRKHLPNVTLRRAA